MFKQAVLEAFSLSCLKGSIGENRDSLHTIYILHLIYLDLYSISFLSPNAYDIMSCIQIFMIIIYI